MSNARILGWIHFIIGALWIAYLSLITTLFGLFSTIDKELILSWPMPLLIIISGFFMMCNKKIGLLLSLSGLLFYLLLSLFHASELIIKGQLNQDWFISLTSIPPNNAIFFLALLIIETYILLKDISSLK